MREGGVHFDNRRAAAGGPRYEGGELYQGGKAARALKDDQSSEGGISSPNAAGSIYSGDPHPLLVPLTFGSTVVSRSVHSRCLDSILAALLCSRALCILRSSNS